MPEAYDRTFACLEWFEIIREDDLMALCFTLSSGGADSIVERSDGS
jgi:hypothetical protein